MLIYKLVKGMRNELPNHAKIIVRLMKKKPLTLKLITLKREMNGTVTMWSPEQRVARLDKNDKVKAWIALNTRLLRHEDKETGFTAALLQSATRYEKREMSDQEALKQAQRRLRRNQTGPFVL